MSLLNGKTAVVTGASSGNGRAIAKTFAEHGASAVVVADIREAPREGGRRRTNSSKRRASTRRSSSAT